MPSLFTTIIGLLLTGSSVENCHLHNLKALVRFHAPEDFSSEDQETVINRIDVMIVKSKIEGDIILFENKAS